MLLYVQEMAAIVPHQHKYIQCYYGVHDIEYCYRQGVNACSSNKSNT